MYKKIFKGTYEACRTMLNFFIDKYKDADKFIRKKTRKNDRKLGKSSKELVLELKETNLSGSFKVKENILGYGVIVLM